MRIGSIVVRCYEFDKCRHFGSRRSTMAPESLLRAAGCRPQPRIRTMGLPRGAHKQRRWSLTLWNGRKLSRQSGGGCASTSTCERCAIRSSRCAPIGVPTSLPRQVAIYITRKLTVHRSKKSAGSSATATTAQCCTASTRSTRCVGQTTR